MLYPRRAPPKVKVASKPEVNLHVLEPEMLFVTIEEMDSFIDKETQLFLIDAKSLEEGKDVSGKTSSPNVESLLRLPR